ncbi:MAG: endonuclease/exonuclease/phosphatase family protein [Clostridia bacterium]|nr:endonuclease/exonuclease/phosphatase family protein [Clostridia bacterium]
MLDKIISFFMGLLTAVMMMFYTPSAVPPINPDPIPEAAKTQQLTIMSYNVYVAGSGERSPENRTPLVVQKIRTYMPDSFGLQEVDEGWIERLTAEFADEYAYVGEHRGSLSNDEASPVFYLKTKYELLDSGTFWLSPTPEKSSRGWDAMIKRICSYAVLKDKETGFVYAHFNAHFDHMGVIARNESVRVIATKISEIAPDIPVVVTGDFNDKEGTDMYNRVLESGLKDTKYAATVSDSGATYHGYGGDNPDGLPIDFIFTNGYVQSVASYKVDREKLDKIFASDHHPVISELTLFNGEEK